RSGTQRARPAASRSDSVRARVLFPLATRPDIATSTGWLPRRALVGAFGGSGSTPTAQILAGRGWLERGDRSRQRRFETGSVDWTGTYSGNQIESATSASTSASVTWSPSRRALA